MFSLTTLALILSYNSLLRSPNSFSHSCFANKSLYGIFELPKSCYDLARLIFLDLLPLILPGIFFMVTPCINTHKYFIIQLMHLIYKLYDR